jgi:hyaluronoglucosaminidase
MNVRPNRYKAAYRDGLDPGILLMWTGDGITRPATLTPATVYAFQHTYGRPPFLWDNYPVNDYNKTRLFLAPLTRRYNVGDLVSGFTMNPLTQPLLGRLSLFTAAEYLMDTAAYKPWESWERAKDELFGHDSEARPVLDAIAALNAERPGGPDGGPWLTGCLRRASRGDKAAVRDLDAFFARLETASAVLERRKAALPEPGIVDELRPWFAPMAKVGAVGRLALQAREAPTPALRARLRAAWTDAKAGVDGKTAATRAVAAFIEASLAAPGQ